jgi:hypothetical protein
MPGIDIMRSATARKGAKVRLDMLVERGDSCIESIDLVEVEAQQKAMLLRLTEHLPRRVRASNGRPSEQLAYPSSVRYELVLD